MSERHALMISKIKAFAVHLVISSVVIAVYLVFVFYIWYPAPYYLIERVWEIIRIVISVDIFLGPLLTLVVYRAGKASLKFDLSAIVALQLVALLWGCAVTFQQRPVYNAFVGNIFTVVSASEIDLHSVKDPNLKNSIWSGPHLVYVDLPYDDAEYIRRGDENLSTGMSFAQYTQFYRPLAAHKAALLGNAIDIQQRMREFSDLDADVHARVKKHGGSLSDYVFMSIEGRTSFGFLMLRRVDLEVVDVLLD